MCVLAYGFFESRWKRIVLLGASEGQVRRLYFLEKLPSRSELVDLLGWTHGPLEENRSALSELYSSINGTNLTVHQRIPIGFEGSDFERLVWNELRRIPAGETLTYSALAKRIGSPRAARAVGTAVGANRIALLVPCHRVIRQDGTLGGFRWGIDLKRQLLSEEGVCFE